MEETAGHRRARDRPGSRNVPLYSFPRITYLTSLGRERTMRGDIHKSSLLCSPRFFLGPSMDFHPFGLCPFYPCTLVSLAPSPRFEPYKSPHSPRSALQLSAQLSLPTRLSTAERERLSAVDGRLRLVASSQTRIKRAIDVGKSPGNLPARPLSWITLAGSVLCTSWLIEKNGDCIRKHAYW